MTNKANLSPRKLTGSWMKRAATAGLHYACLSLSVLWSAVWYLLVLLGLLLFVLPDAFRSRKPHQSMTPKPMTRKLQIPLREDGNKLYVLNPDGTKVPV